MTRGAKRPAGRPPVSHPCFSHWYPRAEGALERMVGEARRLQNAQAVGRTLIVGAGTGLDVPALGPQVTEVILLEPDAAMRDILRQRYPHLPILPDAAEALTLPPSSVDTAISSLVLCSVGQVPQTLRQLARVLRPGGQYLFLEHVSHTGAWGGVQRLLDPLWQRLGAGCHLTRDVAAAIRDSPLALDSVSRVRQGGLVPVIRGRAIKGQPLDGRQESPSAAPGAQ